LDSLVWSELGSMIPRAGGSYVYLKEGFGPDSYGGKIMSFLFVWQFIFTGPMEIASGFIAMAHYLSYITGEYGLPDNNWNTSLIAAFFCLASMTLLYRDTASVGGITLTLWVGTLGAILVTLYFGAQFFELSNFGSIPDNAFEGTGFYWGFLAAARFGVYDFAGYYNCCYSGELMESPKKNIPRAVIGSAVGVCIVYGATYVAVMGYMPWFGPDGFATDDAAAGHFLMAQFYERMFDHRVAMVFAAVVAWTIFGSSFSMMYAYANIPFAAAKGGDFFQWFAHTNEDRQGLADNSLIALGLVTFGCCFVRLDLVIEGMLISRFVVQFAAQAVAVLLLRHKNTDPDTFKVPCAPVTNLITISCFLVLFGTTKNYYFHGDAPLLECSILLILSGVAIGTVFHYCCGSSSMEPVVEDSYPGVVFTQQAETNVALQEPLMEDDEALAR